MKSLLAATLAILIALPVSGQQTVPELEFDSVPDFLKLPEGMNFGGTSGVAIRESGRPAAGQGCHHGRPGA